MLLVFQHQQLQSQTLFFDLIGFWFKAFGPDLAPCSWHQGVCQHTDIDHHDLLKPIPMFFGLDEHTQPSKSSRVMEAEGTELPEENRNIIMEGDALVMLHYHRLHAISVFYTLQ